MDITIQKYGGSSLATDQQINAVADRVATKRRDDMATVLVVSARGSTTDELVGAAETLHATPCLRETDQLLATGELAAAALLAIALRARAVPALSMSGPQAGVRATGRHGAGVVTTVDTERIRASLAEGNVVVVAGFQAMAPSGDVITLGRGGSDTSAVALAAALGAMTCEIYTDVDGIRSADPRVVTGAGLLASLDAPVMAEMAFAGARVMHPRAVELAAVHGVDIVVRHAHRGGTGSTILGRSPMLLEGSAGVSAVTHDTAVSQVVVAGRGDRPTASEILDALAGTRVALDALTWSPPGHDVRLAFCVPRTGTAEVRDALEPVVAAGGGAVEVRPAVGKVSLVGAGLLSRPAITAAALAELAELGIPAECVSSTQIRTCLLVPENRVQDAVVALHHRLRLDREPDGPAELATA